MILFWTLAIALTAVVLLLLLWPMFRSRNKATSNQDAVLEVYRQRFDELAGEADAGLLSSEQRRNMENELASELLQRTAPEHSDGARHQRLTAVLIGLLVPVLAFALYLYLGVPQLIDHPTGGQQAGMPHSVDEMVKKLAARMAANPEDPKGWALLARSYMSLGEYPKAVDSYEHLHRLEPENPEVLVGFADALAMANNGRLSGRPQELVQRALALEPQNPTGLWLAGMAAEEQGQSEQAVAFWQQLLPLLDNEEQAASLRKMIERAGGTAQSQPIETPVTTSAHSAVAVNVSISEELRQQVNDDDTLFVFARAVHGPPMPLAVARRTVADLPLQVTLDDSMAMFPEARLSNFEQVNISARISPGGRAEPQSGDLIGEVTDVAVGSSTKVDVVIDKRLP
jgi:cytochrome c-type biogenesis protein CcmH